MESWAGMQLTRYSMMPSCATQLRPSCFVLLTMSARGAGSSYYDAAESRSIWLPVLLLIHRWGKTTLKLSLACPRPMPGAMERECLHASDPKSKRHGNRWRPNVRDASAAGRQPGKPHRRRGRCADRVG